MNQMDSVLLYILGVNLVSFIMMGIDKQKARKRMPRIPERTLWGLSIIGGALGTWTGMKYFRHKTKHRSFIVGVPVLILGHLGLITYAYISMS